MKKIAVLGCGSQSRVFCMNATKLLVDDYFVTAVCANNHEHAVDLASRIGATAARTVEEMLSLNPDVVVEFAGIEAVEANAEKILQNGADLVIASVGALDDEKFRKHLVLIARDLDRHIYVSSGAIGGFDIMENFGVIGNPQVQIVSTKAPIAYQNTPYMEGKVLSQTEEQVVFEGNVHDAIKGFPRNVNVTVATSLATRAPNTKVKLISDPKATETKHVITLKNDMMHAELSFSSKPDPENPKSSLSSAWSVIALLKSLASPLTFF